MNYTTAVMLSGGMDSTAVLVDALVNSKNPVHAHHIRLANKDGRQQAEYQAVHKILSYCRTNYRTFSYTESGLDVTQFKKTYPDYLIVAFVAAMLSRELAGPIQVAVGIMGSDVLYARQCNKHQQDVAKLMYVAHRFIAAEPKMDGFTMIYPLLHRTKRDIVRDILPPELMAMTWSCRYPALSNGGWNACGKCKVCTERREALRS
jgi:7-cyano-7-deazaguanine synthase in queuosine biosynthesis